MTSWKPLLRRQQRGPWYAGSDWITADLGFKSVLIQLGSNSAADGYDLEYIATANPQAVLELITRLREAEKDTARINYLTLLDDEEFFSLMSDTRMMPEQFMKVIKEAVIAAMKESA